MDDCHGARITPVAAARFVNDSTANVSHGGLASKKSQQQRFGTIIGLHGVEKRGKGPPVLIIRTLCFGSVRIGSPRDNSRPFKPPASNSPRTVLDLSHVLLSLLSLVFTSSRPVSHRRSAGWFSGVARTSYRCRQAPLPGLRRFCPFAIR